MPLEQRLRWARITPVGHQMKPWEPGQRNGGRICNPEVGRKCKGSLQRRSGSTEVASGCVPFVSTAAAEARASSCAHSEPAAREWLEVAGSVSTRVRQVADFRCTSQSWPRSADGEVRELALPAINSRSSPAALR